MVKTHLDKRIGKRLPERKMVIYFHISHCRVDGLNVCLIYRVHLLAGCSPVQCLHFYHMITDVKVSYDSCVNIPCFVVGVVG